LEAVAKQLVKVVDYYNKLQSVWISGSVIVL
jgi:hypothetical protein